MNAASNPILYQAQLLADAVANACNRIAPTWPLDQFIAVNPYWGWRQHAMPEAAATLGVLAGSQLTMPRDWFRQQWRDGHLRMEHLHAVVACREDGPTQQELRDALNGVDTQPPVRRLPMVTDLCDAAAPVADPPWSDTVLHQISQHCAASFDLGQARWAPDRSAGLFRSWRDQLGHEHALPWRHERRVVLARIQALPSDPMSVIGDALAALGLPTEAWPNYLSAALLRVNGWAAWCAYRRWQAGLAQAQDDTIVELLAIRLAWERLLQQDMPQLVDAAWATRWSDAQAEIDAWAHAQRIDWLLQEAVERAYQQPLSEALANIRDSGPSGVPSAPPTVAVQAVFCIDVRSEPLRRAIESVAPRIQTRGFAGFFGLPIAYNPLGSALVRPQLPGLLAASLTASTGTPQPAPSDAALARSSGDGDGVHLAERLRARRHAALDWRQRWNDLRASASSAFSFVETCGLAYAGKLLAATVGSQAAPQPWEDTGLPAAAQGLQPRLDRSQIDTAGAAELAARILRAMGLTGDFAPIVLLVGHGSQSSNNLHAAGLDCGACGGQSGEVNARVLAGLLNDAAVRNALQTCGISIPGATHFLAALHNTTTDDITLFDTGKVPDDLGAALQALRQALATASQHTRQQRAPALGLGTLCARPDALHRALLRRANDWAQLQPEWGLANNAALIVAPRARTHAIDLAGRAFLHEYDWQQDSDLAVLELVMTAPMVVANWINLQYLASTVDPQRYGSGDKLLHNAVGGRIGVFEGNGGDLRIGLPWQSLHDGRQLRHAPLRLSVYIEAPRAGIDQVIARHALVRQLVDNGWLHLFRIDPRLPLVEQRRQGNWHTVAEGSQPSMMTTVPTTPSTAATMAGIDRLSRPGNSTRVMPMVRNTSSETISAARDTVV
jgi:uncharacterized protein